MLGPKVQTADTRARAPAAMHEGGQVDRLRQTGRPVALGAGCDNFMEGSQSMRSRDSANNISECRGLHLNSFAKEVEHIKLHN